VTFLNKWRWVLIAICFPEDVGPQSDEDYTASIDILAPRKRHDVTSGQSGQF
jgi:hypothetical protein